MHNLNEEMALMSEHRQNLLKAARLHQLYQQADQDRGQFGERLMTLVGDLMISGGTKLKERAEALSS